MATIGGGSRRNGKQASCEPCRKAKIRCDHHMPICGRCARRNLQAECFYHPAPLTRTSFSLYSNPRDSLELGSENTRHTQQPTTTTTIIPEPCPLVTGVRQVACIIRQLQMHHELVGRVLREYYAISLGAMVPGRITMGILDSLHALYESCGGVASNTCESDFDQLAKCILENTAAGYTPVATMTVAEFIASSSGRNLQLQGLGHICNTAARSIVFGLAKDDDSHESFLQTMLDSSTLCLTSARELAPRIDDTLVWLSHDNLLLTIACKGYGDPLVWRRLGDLTSDVYASGMHREDTLQKDAPFFLADLRRRTFAKVYQTDKTTATFFDCPPRILRRFSDTRMPLDLKDDELLADGPELQEALSRLTPEGWNLGGGSWECSTWVRLRCILGPWREQVMESAYYPRPLSAAHALELKDLSARGHLLWKSLPSHLRYTSAYWKAPNFSPRFSNMFTIVYLSHLQCDFQIHRLLEATDEAAVHALLEIAKNMLATVLQLGQARDRSTYLRYDFEFVLLTYGMPSAAAMTSMLAKSTRGSSKPLPAGFSRATIIRNLSVFVSHLDTIFHPENANHAIATQASSSITRTLDEVLEPVPDIGTLPSFDGSTQVLASGGSGLGVVDPFLGTFDEQLFNDWMSSIDWSATNSGWSTL